MTVGDPVLRTGKPLSVELGPGQYPFQTSAIGSGCVSLSRTYGQHCGWNSTSVKGKTEEKSQLPVLSMTVVNTRTVQVDLHPSWDQHGRS